jgi:hypothetical protein
MKRLQLDNQIDFIPRKTALTVLSVKESTLRNYQWVLNELKPNGWSYEPHSKGFTRKSLEILWVFRQLILNLGTKQAIKNLKETLNASQR